MKPVRRLLRQGSVYTLGTAVQLSASAVVLPILTRLLAPQDYGVVALVLSVNVVLATLVGLGIPAAVTREFFEKGRGHHDAPRLIVSTALVALVGTALIACTLPIWADSIAPDDGTALILGVAIAVPAATAGAAAALLLVQERPGGYLAVVLTSSLGAQLCGIGALLVLSNDAEVYLGGYMVGVALAAVCGLVLSGAVGSSPAPRAVLGRALNLGLPTVPHSLAIFVLALGDRIVIAAVDEAGAVGRYQVAYALGSLGIAFLSAVQNAWVPITFSAPDDARWQSLAKMTTLVVRTGALAAVALALISPVALPVLAPAEYEPGDLLGVTILVAAAAIPWALYLPMSQILFWERRTRSLAWMTPVAAIFNLVLVALLVPAIGLEGAGIATLAALILQAGLCAWVASRIVAVPFETMRLASTIAAAGAALALAAVAPEDGVEGVTLRVVGLAGILALGVYLLRAELGRERREDDAVPAAG